MENKIQEALNYFNKDSNCSQAVLLAFAKDKEAASKIATPFGAGMGKLQRTCGAVTGALMALGLTAGKGLNDNRDKTTECYNLAKKFIQDFERIHTTSSCSELIGCDFNTPEGAQYFKDKNLRKEKCEQFIADAVMLISPAIDK